MNQAFVSMVCLQCLSFPNSARGPGAGAHPHSNPGCGAKGACNSGPASGLSVTRWASLGAAVAIYLLQGARLQSLPLFSFLVVLGCLIVVDNQLSHHQQDRRSEGVVHSRPSAPYRSNRLTQPVDHVSIPQTCLAFVSWSSFLCLLCCFFDRSSRSRWATGRERGRRRLDPDSTHCQPPAPPRARLGDGWVRVTTRELD